VKLCDFEVGPDRPFFLIAGPCVVESEQLALDTSGVLKEICERLGIPFIFKSSFVTIDIDKNLGCRSRKCCETVRNARRAIGFGHELLSYARKLDRRHAERILKAHGETRRCAHASHRRRHEHQGLGILQLGELHTHIRRDFLDV
jgi:hypothetical protein